MADQMNEPTKPLPSPEPWFYWIRQTPDTEWEIAEWFGKLPTIPGMLICFGDEPEFCWVTGTNVRLLHSKIAEIGPRVLPPEK